MISRRERRSEYKTPIADALIKLSSQFSSSFHALPIWNGHSLQGSPVAVKYAKIFGRNYLNNELTVTGRHFDSFFFPKNVIKEAEEMAAALYGAEGTFFITNGTTVSNQIALDAIYKKGTRVLLDKACHQSLHFGLHRRNAVIDYLLPAWNCEHSGKSIWSLHDLLSQALRAQAEAKPYELIVINAHSYDGLVYDIPKIIEHLLQNGVATRTFLIDEAWGAANYFNSRLKSLTAMRARPLIETYPDLKIVATQSAHKSLSCLRQASMIHYCGGKELGECLKLSRFRIHTTSPSYPILASLDLARAQMQIEGESLTIRANFLAEQFSDAIQNCPQLSLLLQMKPTLKEDPFRYVYMDPTKVSINMEAVGLMALNVKDTLFQEHGIYINRNTASSLLLNFHIGVRNKCVRNVIKALREVMPFSHPLARAKASENFIIPYPPGVPIVVPGEAITPAIEEQIRSIQRSGVNIFYA